MKAGKSSFLITGLPIFSALAALIPGFISKASAQENGKIAILTLLLSAAAGFYIRMNEETVLNKRFAKSIILFSYLSSIGLLLFIPASYMFCFWMLGGLFLAMTIDSKLGLLLHFTLSFILVIARSLKPEIVIQILILGVLMYLLAGALRSKSTVIYAIIIILSTNVTLSFVINNFIFPSKENYNYLNSLFSLLVVLVAAYFLSYFYEKTQAQQVTYAQQVAQAQQVVLEQPMADEEEGRRIGSSYSEVSVKSLERADQKNDINLEINETNNGIFSSNNIGQDIVTSQEVKESQNKQTASAEVRDATANEITANDVITNEIITKEADLQAVIGTHSSYDILCSTENELLQRLKEFSLSLHAHALHIADLSCRAAKEIGADEQLAMAGGLYHEIGKIKGKNYIEEGLQIAEDYAFPKELKAILKEHNIKYEKPSSVEAAIVMLTDNVVSTIDYISKTDDHKFTSDKIIDNIFQMRMEKGAFDKINLSLREFKQLKEFFSKEFK